MHVDFNCMIKIKCSTSTSLYLLYTDNNLGWNINFRVCVFVSAWEFGSNFLRGFHGVTVKIKASSYPSHLTLNQVPFMVSVQHVLTTLCFVFPGFFANCTKVNDYLLYDHGCLDPVWSHSSDHLHQSTCTSTPAGQARSREFRPQ